MPKVTHKIKNEIAIVKQEVREKTAGYIVTALGLVAGLAWNDAVKATIEYLFPASEQTLLAKFSYAVILTFIIVLLSVYILRFFKKDAQKSLEEKGKNK
jgi:hypothetical protein